MYAMSPSLASPIYPKPIQHGGKEGDVGLYSKWFENLPFEQQPDEQFHTSVEKLIKKVLQVDKTTRQKINNIRYATVMLCTGGVACSLQVQTFCSRRERLLREKAQLF